MIIIKLQGGLGNQLFQYSLGRSLSLKLNTELKLDLTAFKTDKNRKYELDKFNIVAKIASENEVKKLVNVKSLVLSKLSKYLTFLYGTSAYISEKKYGFDPRVLNLPDNRYIEGYWQSEKYFKNNSELIKKEFALKSKAIGANFTTLKKITNENNSVCLHVRRGDYVSDKKAKNIFGIFGLEYYSKSIKLLEKKLDKPSFFVFSDDIDWAKKNIKTKNKIYFIDNNSSNKGYEDLRLMSACKNFIIANSSFSWWGAWLCQNKDKIIIAPKKWFKDSHLADINDLIPKDWLRI